jgi:hypothetical protein
VCATDEAATMTAKAIKSLRIVPPPIIPSQAEMNETSLDGRINTTTERIHAQFENRPRRRLQDTGDAMHA